MVVAGKRTMSAAVALATVGALVACGSSSTGGSAASTTATPGAGSSSLAGQTITLYNGQHEQTTDALVTAFEKQTGIKVKVRSDDEDVLAQQITAEGSHGRADVFFTENTAPLVRLDEAGLLATANSTAVSSVPAADVPTDHNWVGVSSRVSELVYNSDDLKPSELPTSVYGLADPKWKGKLSIAPGETDFAPIVTSIAASKGDAAALTWLRAIKANAGSHQEADNETLVANVNKGTTQIGIINHYYWYRLRDEVGAKNVHSALAYFAPGDDGYLIDVSGVGVMKSSKHQQAAQAFASFIVSKQGETVLAAGDSFEYPLGSGVAPNPVLSPFSTVKAKTFSLTQIGDGKNAVKLLQQAGLL
jgi:iron(III) transport system substrate-binding protein